ncbi:MAG: hypothetical protein E3J87_10795, partial [Candidatus Cloacimonadota bacterium]
MKMEYKLLILLTIFLLLFSFPLFSSQRNWAVGDTTSFWAYDFGFFQKYYKVNAMLRSIGDHCYIFTQEDTLTTLSIAANVSYIIFQFSFISFPAREVGGTLYRTSDFGETWQGSGTGVPTDFSVVCLAYHSTSSNTGVLLAGLFGGGAYWNFKAGNGDWPNQNDSLGDLMVNAVAISPDTMSLEYRM